MAEDGKLDLQEQMKRAIVFQSFKEVKQLVENGAPLLAEYQLLEPSGKLVGNGSVLDFAMLHKRYKLVAQVLEWLGSASELAKKSRYALAWAARDGQAGILRSLLLLGADAKQLDEANRSALLSAAMRGKKQCVAMLLQEGALEQEPCPQELETWLSHWKIAASCHESSEAMDDGVELVPSGSMTQPNQVAPGVLVVQDRWSNVPHTRAHWSLRPQDTPLQMQLEHAIDREGVKRVRELISQEGTLTAAFVLDPTTKDYGNFFDLMIQKRRFKLALECASLPEAEELIRQSNRSLAWAASEGQLNLVRELTKLGAPVGQCDQHGRSALSLASIRGHSECAATLLEAGAWESETCPTQVLEWAAFWRMNCFPKPA